MGFDGAAKKLTEKPHFYRLFSKCLITKEMASITRFEVVIWDHDYNLVFKTNERLNEEDNKITSMEAEIRGLMRGLAEATNLGISHIYIYCHHHTIFQYLSRRLDPRKKNIALLMNDLQRMRKRFRYSNLIMVDGKNVNFSYKLAAMDDSLVSPVRRRPLYFHRTKQIKKESCVICFEDVETVFMFSVDKCGHRFCINCVKQHIEVKLLDGTIPRCPQNECKFRISIDKCCELLNPKLSLIWEGMIREASIPFTEKVYCPYPKCSYLMSKTELSSTSVDSGLRRCFKCGGSFCVNCKVPWHNTLSCTDYDDVQVKTLANRKGWKQCGKCKHMVERSSGCNHMQCRCGNAFCYACGAELMNGTYRHECRMFRPQTFRPQTFLSETFGPATVRPQTFRPETFLPETFGPATVRPENEIPSSVGFYLGLSVMMAFGVFCLILTNSVC